MKTESGGMTYTAHFVKHFLTYMIISGRMTRTSDEVLVRARARLTSKIDVGVEIKKSFYFWMRKKLLLPEE